MNNNSNSNLINKILKKRDILEKKVEKALEFVYKKSYYAEIIIKTFTGMSITTSYGNLENIEYNNDSIFFINIYFNNSKGSASSTNLSLNAIYKTINAAINIANYTNPDDSYGIAEKKILAYEIPNLNLFFPIEFNIKKGFNLAAKAENIAFNIDKNITYTEGGRFNTYFKNIIFGNSYGMLKSYSTSKHYLSCCVIAKKNINMERNYAYTVSRDFNDLFSAEWVGKECAKRTIERLNSKKISTIKSPVIFSAEIANDLFKNLVYAINGNNVYRKSTFLMNKLEKLIFPKWLSIKEYPYILKGLGSAPFDSEGVKPYNRNIIKNGILKTWLLNCYTARKLGLRSTGHASGIYNWFVTNQNISFKDLLKIMGKGLIVTELMGQGVRTITGDYSKGAFGFWVENGEIQYPVSEITISGNLNEMFLNIINISNDIEKRNNIQCGSVLISEINISGK